MSGRAIEAAGDVDVLLLDKTGTITLRWETGRQLPFSPYRVQEQELAGSSSGFPLWMKLPGKVSRCTRKKEIQYP